MDVVIIMRDSKRIKPMLKLLEATWKKHPDLRLGQLMELCYGESGSTAPLFYVEDNILQLGIVEFYKRKPATIPEDMKIKL